MMTVFWGSELEAAVWNASRAVRAAGIKSVEDARFDWLIGRTVAETLDEMLRRPRREGQRLDPRRIIQAA